MTVPMRWDKFDHGMGEGTGYVNLDMQTSITREMTMTSTLQAVADMSDLASAKGQISRANVQRAFTIGVVTGECREPCAPS